MNAIVSALPRMLPALRGNLLVGLTLAVVTLPQAIAFSTTLAGLPPHFGIYAAIWGVLFTALLNPSRVFSVWRNVPSGLRYEISPPSSNGVTMTGSRAAPMVCSEPLAPGTTSSGGMATGPDAST